MATFLGTSLVKFWEYFEERRKAVREGFWEEKVREYLPILASLLLTSVFNKISRTALEKLTFRVFDFKSQEEGKITTWSILTSLYNTVFVYFIIFSFLSDPNPLGVYGLATKISGLIFISATLSGVILNLFPVHEILTVFPSYFKYRG